MATSFNPFGRAGGTAHAGVADTTGRGRGAARGSQFQPRGSRGRRASKWRGAGQGIGRGRGASPGATSAPHATANADMQRPAPTSSPFSQLSQPKPTPSPFGGQQAHSKTPFTGMTNGRGGQRGRGVARGMPRQSLSKPNFDLTLVDGSMASVPVEDASTLASYHQRYDQVSKLFQWSRRLETQRTEASDLLRSSKLIVRSSDSRQFEMGRWQIQISLRL